MELDRSIGVILPLSSVSKGEKLTNEMEMSERAGCHNCNFCEFFHK